MPPSILCLECAEFCDNHLTRVLSPSPSSITARCYAMVLVIKLRLKKRGSDLPKVTVPQSGRAEI